MVGSGLGYVGGEIRGTSAPPSMSLQGSYLGGFWLEVRERGLDLAPMALCFNNIHTYPDVNDRCQCALLSAL